MDNKYKKVTTVTVPGSMRPGTRLSRTGLSFHQVLGRGAFGKVVLAKVPGYDTLQAIKIVKIRDNAEAIERERRILHAVRDCPFICHLNAALQSQKNAYYIMEYLSGGSLQSLLDKCGSLNTETVRFYTAELICGIQFLHSHGISHQDIKPNNIMLAEDGHIKLIDLGLAKDGLSPRGSICDPADTLTIAADWRRLGIVVSKMSLGRSPFCIIKGEKVSCIINLEEPGLDEDLKHLMQNLLVKDPEMRLGMSGNIRDHPFFRNICWEELEMRRAQPPLFHHTKKNLTGPPKI